MAFVPQTDAGEPNANAAITVEFANTYHADRNNTAWANLTEQQKHGAIINATDFVYRNFSFDGIPFKTTQRLHFPIFDADGDSSLIPEAFKEAVAELAFVAKDRPLISRTPQDRGWLIEDSTGPLVKRWAPGEGMPSTAISFDWLEKMLAPFIVESESGAYVYVERA